MSQGGREEKEREKEKLLHRSEVPAFVESKDIT